MKKTFVLTQFGKPHPWTEKYLENIQKLEKYGYYWKIFSPNTFPSKGNYEFIKMNATGFSRLIADTCGIDPKIEIVDGLPSKPVSDYYVATGLIFEKWLKDSDYWGITNWDVVYGRLDHFIPDQLLKEFDIYSDDVFTINGVFSLFKNTEKVNNLFKEIQGWQQMFTYSAIMGTDEYKMTEVVRKAVQEERLRFIYPKYYPLHSHDRLENHVPEIKLKVQDDDSLWELLADTNPPQWEHARPFIGREIPYFHFQRTKKWPIYE